MATSSASSLAGSSLLTHHLPALKTSKALSLIAVLVCLIYSPTLGNGFVWDDNALILRDPLIRSWRLIPEGFRHFLFTDATASDFYRPLQRLSYTIDYALYGQKPWGYHLTNLLLHAGAAGALFLFLKRIASAPMALVVALLWAVHPLHSSAVAYVAGRADLLSALFGFAGLCLISRAQIWPAALCLLGALLSKESGAVFIPIAFLFFPQTRRLLLPAMAVVMVAYLGLRLTAEQMEAPRSSTAQLAARPSLMSRALAEYTGLILAPINLHMERDVSSGIPQQSDSPALKREFQTLVGILLAAGLLCWFLRAENKSLLIAFGIAYLPVSNLFELNASAAEHWLYLPMAFLLAAALLSLKPRPLLLAVVILWGILLAVRTFVRTFDWKNERTFLERTIAAGGATPRMYVQLGNLESSQGNQARAIEHIGRALTMAPNQPFALLALANSQLRNGNYAEARHYLQKAHVTPWLRPQVLETQAVLEYKEKSQVRFDLLEQAVALAPNYWPARKRYIQLLDETGRTSEALEKLATYINIHPYRADSWLVLSKLLLRADQPEAAIHAYEQAMAYDVELSRNR